MKDFKVFDLRFGFLVKNYIDLILPCYQSSAPQVFWVPGGDIYTIFDEESESEVENLEILHPDLEIQTLIAYSKFHDLINFSVLLDSRHVQLAIYTVFDEESESEVKKCQILKPGGENQEKLT